MNNMNLLGVVKGSYSFRIFYTLYIYYLRVLAIYIERHPQVYIP